MTVAHFLSVSKNIDNLKEGLQYLYVPSQEELHRLQDEVVQWGRQRDQSRRSPEALQTFKSLYPDPVTQDNGPYPSLYREFSAKMLWHIAQAGCQDPRDSIGSEAPSTSEDGEEHKKKTAIPIVPKLEFVNDPLFCEWVYVVDLDKELLEVYHDSAVKHEGHRFEDVGPKDAMVLGLILTIPFSKIFLMNDVEKEFLGSIREGLDKRSVIND